MRKILRGVISVLFVGQLMGWQVDASSGQDHLTPQPDEMKQHMLGKLDTTDLRAIGSVNKDLSAQANNENLWQQKAMEAGIEKKADGKTWKDTVLNVEKLGPLKHATEYLLSLGYEQVGPTDLKRLLDKMAKEGGKEISEDVKKEEDRFYASAALNMPRFQGGKIVFRQLVKFEQDHPIDAYFANGEPVYDELFLMAYEKNLPILVTATGLIPIQKDDPEIKFIKARSAWRHAIKKLYEATR